MTHLFFVFLFSFSISAAPKGQYKATIHNLFPFGGVTSAGEPHGLYLEILRSLESEVGASIHVEVVPLMRAVEMLKTREADMTLMFDTKSSDEIGTKKIPLYERTNYVYSPYKVGFKGKNDVLGNIGRINGGCFDLVDNSQVKLIDVKDYEQGFKMMQKGRLQGMCGPKPPMEFSFQKMGLKKSEIKEIAISRRMVWLHVQPSIGVERFKKLEAGVKKIVENGTLTRLRKKYNDFN